MDINKVFDITHLAFDFIKEQLRMGCSLGNLLLQEINIEKGRLITYAPIDVDEKILSYFGRNFMTPLSPDITIVDQEWFENQIQNYLKTYQNPMILFYLVDGYDNLNSLFSKPNTWSNPNMLKERVLFYENEVYDLILEEDKDNIDWFRDVTWNSEIAIYAYSLGIMTHYLKELDPILKDNKKIDLDLFRKLVQNTEKISILAYEGDSHIIWEKPD